MKTTDYTSKAVVNHYRKYVISHVYIGKPAFIKLIGKVKGLRIMDLGCGTGHFCEDLVRKGAIMTGIDRSKAFIDIAKSNAAKEGLKINYLLLEGANLKGVKSKSFDKIYMFQVTMNVSNVKQMQGIFKEVGRTLKSKGKFIFSIQHPLLLRNYSDNFRKMSVPKNFSYYANGSSYTARKRRTDLKWMTFTNTHWSMEFIFNALITNGFVITNLKEPAPKKGSYWKYLKNLNAAPEYVFIEATKK